MAEFKPITEKYYNVISADAGFYLVSTDKEGKNYGIINSDGDVIVQPTADFMSTVRYGAVIINNKVVIDLATRAQYICNGANEILADGLVKAWVRAGYYLVTNYRTNETLAYGNIIEKCGEVIIVTIGDETTIINYGDKLIKFHGHEYVRYIPELGLFLRGDTKTNFYHVYDYNSDTVLIDGLNEPYFYVPKDLKVIVVKTADGERCYSSDGTAITYNKAVKGFIIEDKVVNWHRVTSLIINEIEDSGKFGVVNIQIGKIIAQPMNNTVDFLDYNLIALTYKTGIYPIQKRFHIIDYAGNTIVPEGIYTSFKYYCDHVNKFNDGRFIKLITTDGEIIYNLSQRVQTTPVYKNVELGYNTIKVFDGNYYGLYDLEGKQLLDNNYLWIVPNEDGKSAFVRHAGGDAIVKF